MTLFSRLACTPRTATLFITLASVSGLCLAQAAATPAKKELVQKVLQLQQASFEGLARTLVEQSIAPLGQQAGAFLQSRVPAEQREALAKEVQAEFNKYGDEVIPLVRDRTVKVTPATVGPILEDKLSEDELKQVIAALESPGFRKFVNLGPEIQRALSQKLVAELQPQIDPKLKALDQNISRKLMAAAPAPGAAGSKPAASGAKK